MENTLFIVTCVATCIAAFSALATCFISGGIAIHQINSTNINLCNERYTKILKDIKISILTKDYENFKSSCGELFDLQGHQYLLWNDWCLPNKIFKYWINTNSKKFQNIIFTDEDGKETSLKDVWNENKSSHEAPTNSYFIECMDYILAQNIKKIKRHISYFLPKR